MFSVSPSPPSQNPIIVMWEQGHGSLLQDERTCGGELNYPKVGHSRAASSQVTPNMGAAQQRPVELPVQQSVADCRHTIT